MAAQVAASHISMSGSAGFSGGFLPVATFHDASRALRARAAAPSAATREKTVQILEPPDAMG